MSKTAKTAISVCLAAILMLGNAGCQTEKSVLESAQTAAEAEQLKRGLAEAQQRYLQAEDR